MIQSNFSKKLKIKFQKKNAFFQFSKKINKNKNKIATKQQKGDEMA
jgi:hypothetical protein